MRLPPNLWAIARQKATHDFVLAQEPRSPKATGKSNAKSVLEVVWEGEEPARSTSAGIVVDGRFIYNAASSVKALDAATGNEIWQTPVPNAGFQHPIPVVWNDLVLVNGVHFTAVDFGTGAIRWTIPCAQDPTRFVRSQRITIAGNSTPIVAGDFAYFGSNRLPAVSVWF